MDKIRKRFHNLSMKTAFVLYVAVFLILAIFLYMGASEIINGSIGRLYVTYAGGEEWRSLLESKGVEVRAITMPVELMEVEQIPWKVKAEYFFYFNIAPFLSIMIFPLCILAAALLFYKSKLKRPLALLEDAAQNIAGQNLDFRIAYDREDEMGRLCSSFERMREALLQNNREMWRQMEEHRRLNAAFSHDLRTPLTVLKGQCEMLCTYMPQGKITKEKAAEVLNTMYRHTLRLERYVSTMNRLQSLEDIAVNYAKTDADHILSVLTGSGKTICGKLVFHIELCGNPAGIVLLDEDILLQVYENLLSNAARYAREKIEVKLCLEEEKLLLTVSDDGPGFTPKCLQEAARPFYRTEESPGEHFGMGLYICRVLCEKHGGSLLLKNGQQGACITAAFSISSVLE